VLFGVYDFVADLGKDREVPGLRLPDLIGTIVLLFKKSHLPATRWLCARLKPNASNILFGCPAEFPACLLRRSTRMGENSTCYYVHCGGWIAASTSIQAMGGATAEPDAAALLPGKQWSSRDWITAGSGPPVVIHAARQAGWTQNGTCSCRVGELAAEGGCERNDLF
jgi:hypothetical protein